MLLDQNLILAGFPEDKKSLTTEIGDDNAGVDCA